MKKSKENLFLRDRLSADPLLKPTRKNKVEISMLTNSHHYFIEWAFIMALDNRYRLIVINKGELLTDLLCKSVRSARIAFAKYYSNRGWKNGVRSQWSPFYEPDPEWLVEKFSG